MKKIAMALLSAGILVSTGLQADENAGGADGSVWASGEMKKTAIIGGTVVAGLLVAGVANSNGKIVKAPVDPIDPEPECTGTDPLVDGVCTGTTTTVTVTASGTGTGTITVPVTFTYLPTISS